MLETLRELQGWLEPLYGARVAPPRVCRHVDKARGRPDSAAQRFWAHLAGLPPVSEGALAADPRIASYDGRTHQILLHEEDRAQAETRFVLAHELAHAYQWALHGPPPRPHPFEDRAYAEHCLREGEATLVALVASGKLGAPSDRSVDDVEASVAELEVATATTPIPVHRTYAYTTCTGFAARSVARRGWDGHLAGWSRPPPTTFDTVYPERYLEGEAGSPRVPTPRLAALESAGFELAAAGDLGVIPMAGLLGLAGVSLLPGWDGARFAYYEAPVMDEAVSLARLRWADPEIAEKAANLWLFVVGLREEPESKFLRTSLPGSGARLLGLGARTRMLVRGREVLVIKVDDPSRLDALLGWGAELLEAEAPGLDRRAATN